MFDFLALIFAAIVIYLICLEKKALGRVTSAGLLFVFCALVANPDRFDSFKFSFSGVETKAREVIQQAQVTIEKLQKLSMALAEGSLSELAFSGQVFVGLSSTEKFREHDQIIAQLREIGVKPYRYHE